IRVEAARHHQRSARKTGLKLERDRNHRLGGGAAAMQEDEQVVRAVLLRRGKAVNPARGHARPKLRGHGRSVNWFASFLRCSMQKAGFLTSFWALAKPYWVSERRTKGLLLLVTVIGLSLGAVYLEVQFNTWNKDFYNALEKKD